MTNIETLIDRQIRKWEAEKKASDEPDAPAQKDILPIITVSRQRGSSGSYLARKLAEKFGYEYTHRQVIDIICRDSGFRRRVIESLDGKTKSQIDLWIEGMLHEQYVDASDYFKYLYHTITALAQHGGIVLVGRGGNFVLTLQTGFHIRVIAHEKRRIERIMKFANVDEKTAMTAIKDSDNGREEFIRSNFNKDINDPNYYDLVINTGFIEIDDALDVAVEAINAKFNLLRQE
jgi:cytidylate kinase